MSSANEDKNNMISIFYLRIYVLLHFYTYLDSWIMTILFIIFLQSFSFFSFILCPLDLRTQDICPSMTLEKWTNRWKYLRTFWRHVLAIPFVLFCVLKILKWQTRRFPTNPHYKFWITSLMKLVVLTKQQCMKKNS